MSTSRSGRRCRRASTPPSAFKRALDEGAELVFVWGGDGMVQRSIDKLAGSGVTLAIIPAGTANLFASSLDIPSDIAKAVEIGLNGRDRMLDVGKINGERFAVMAGAGLDAHMIQRRRRRPEGPLRAARVHLDGVEEHPRRAVQGADRHQRRALVQGHGELRPARQRRLALRRHRGVRQRAARRRPARGRRHERRGHRPVGAHGGAHGDRHRRPSRRSSR